LPLLVEIIREDKGEARVKALGITISLSCDADNKKIMCESSLGLLPLLVEIMREDKGDARVDALGTTWNMLLLLSNMDKFVQISLHCILLDLLIDPSVIDELREKVMTAIMVYCRYPPAAKAFRALVGAVEMISRLTNDLSANGLKAVLILSQLVGRDESSSTVNTQSLLQSRPSTLDQIIDVLENNIALRDGTDYELGNFDLNAVTSAVLSLCISDANKTIMVKSRRLLELFVQLLKAFVDNNPQYKRDGRGGVGGGGDDKETASYIIDSLLQLSFYYTDDKALIREYMSADLDLASLLQGVLNLPADRRLETEATKAAGNLLMRLQLKSQITSTIISSASVITRRHIMLSYAWGANKQLVVELQRELMKIGYDVWRDEDGSSVVPAMSGGVDDRMAEAIENSYAVIVCVSPQYKESANCQMEGKYCNALYKKKRVKIFYVMMSEDYHTNSTTSVDGWLGLMVGDALWYPLWSRTCVCSTVTSLINVIGENGKRCAGASSPGVDSVFSITSNVASLSVVTAKDNISPAKIDIISNTTDTSAVVSSPAIKQPLDLLQSAWEALISDAHAVDTGKEELAKKIQDYGLTKCEDLKYLEESEVTELSQLLKVVPRRKFKDYLNEFMKQN